MRYIERMIFDQVERYYLEPQPQRVRSRADKDFEYESEAEEAILDD